MIGWFMKPVMDMLAGLFITLSVVLVLAIVGFILLRYAMSKAGGVAKRALTGVPGISLVIGLGLGLFTHSMALGAVGFVGSWVVFRRTRGGRKVSRYSRNVEGWWGDEGQQEMRGRIQLNQEHTGKSQTVELVRRHPPAPTRAFKAEVCCPTGSNADLKLLQRLAAAKWRMVTEAPCPDRATKVHRSYQRGNK